MGQEGVTSSGKVVNLETRLVLVRKDQLAWLKLVDLDGSSIVVLLTRVSFGSALLFTKLLRRTRMRVYRDRPKLDTKVTNDNSIAKILKVLEPQMSPVSVS